MERDFQIHRSDQDYAVAEFFRWTIAFLIGVAMGCLGFMVDWGIETLNNFKYNSTFDIVNSVGAAYCKPRARMGLELPHNVRVHCPACRLQAADGMRAFLFSAVALNDLSKIYGAAWCPSSRADLHYMVSAPYWRRVAVHELLACPDRPSRAQAASGGPTSCTSASA